MPVLPADLILPTGSMPADWHATQDIQAWINLGYDSAPVEASTAQQDGIAAAYAYYRGYSAQADTLLGSPDSMGMDGMSIAQSNGRYDRMLAKAESFRVQWEALIGEVTYVEPVVVLRQSRSAAVPIVYTWG